jgi:predicted heme/steroid binding protein
MAFQVYVQRYRQPAPEAVSGFISGKQAVRLMGSIIRGKRYDASVCRIYAVGQRFGWYYSQSELKQQLGMCKKKQQCLLRDFTIVI